MNYRTVTIDYLPETREMAEAIEKKASEMAQTGWELMAVSVTGSSATALVFRNRRAEAACGNDDFRSSAVGTSRRSTSRDLRADNSHRSAAENSREDKSRRGTSRNPREAA